MEQEFWQARWRENRIGFHEAAPNSLLTKHFSQLGLEAGHSVFVPLCGKALDLDWLLSKGLRVTGVEFNQGAVEEVFARLGLAPEVSRQDGLIRYQADGLTLYAGDFFALSPAHLGRVDAVYDRAALVAVKPEDRQAYAAHLNRITGTARQMLIGFDYDQSLMDGPPFSVPGSAVQALYQGSHEITLIEERAADGRVGERCNALEQAWLLEPLS
ncbi:thiopurine S-methyltransferase [Leisingera sp. McT4-56]|uniref:thiopurine S-methyltransferase n=1 Tax=Leisingera sp. McT4-56 TaxID=2881255 RepID=UPI001CF7FB26|nr:thiopurine S-methyltransferase [Leisingera sp. McT4-56]MCB4454266.1 thiopurine S-methyltransferase [Leisingera sp. McT4-56]